MDPFKIVIVLALLATLGTVMLGVFTMGAGGEIDKYAGTKLMWTRIGLQAFAAILMLIALVMR